MFKKSSSGRRRHTRHPLRWLTLAAIPMIAFFLPAIPLPHSETAAAEEPTAPRGSLHIPYTNKPAEPALGDWNGRLAAARAADETH